MEQIRAERLTLGYGRNEVVRRLDLSIRRGEFVSIIGPSGAGKTTLLMGINATGSILGGKLTVLGKELGTIRQNDLKELRSRIGVVFQGFNLVARQSVLDNVAGGMLRRMSLLAALCKYYSYRQYGEIYEYLRMVGMEGEALSRCDRLSGGQKQRVAIARALAQLPEILLADEPVSSLDPPGARNVLEIMRNANRTYGITVIVNLHQLDYAREFCHRVIGMNGGAVVYDGPPDRLCRAALNAIYRSPAPGVSPVREGRSISPAPADVPAIRDSIPLTP